VNSDGQADILLGETSVDRGSVYVLFGPVGFGGTIDPRRLVARGRGYRILGSQLQSPDGIANVGDVNGDGRSDAIIGARFEDGARGAAYVVFGKETSDPIDLARIREEGRGYRITGAHGGDEFGASVAGAGDVNGDGASDTLIGATSSHAGCGACDDSDLGFAYVVFGQASTEPISVADFAGKGYEIRSGQLADSFGVSVANGGDVNGDGTPDAIVGAPKAENNGLLSGSAYVVFGQNASPTIDVRDLGARGFRIDGSRTDWAGWSVAGAGDVNRDGSMDILVGAPAGGYTAVVFGRASGGTIKLSQLETERAGYRIIGGDLSDVGRFVTNIGDVNGDNRPDAGIGAPTASPYRLGRSSYSGGSFWDGSVFVVFGRADTTTLDVRHLGAEGYRFNGFGELAQIGEAVKLAGDVNGDGQTDLFIDSDTRPAYLVSIPEPILGTPGDDVLTGTSENEVIWGLGGRDTLTGGGGHDVLIGGPGKDRLVAGGNASGLFGEAGADELRGGSGKDRIYGGPGKDRALGTGDRDYVDGETGADRLRGGAGRDRILGGRGLDVLEGGAGADVFYARDRAADSIAGGLGRDRAWVDHALDRLRFVEEIKPVARRPSLPIV
jgi:Ca2+-binding RTX toxin-like protein